MALTTSVPVHAIHHLPTDDSLWLSQQVGSHKLATLEPESQPYLGI